MKTIGALKLSSKLIIIFFVIVIIHTGISLFSLTFIISRTNMSSQQLQVKNTTHGVSRYLSKVVNDLTVKAKLFSGQDKIINYTEYGLYNLLKRQLAVYWESLGIDTITIYSESLEPIASIGEHLIMDGKFKSTLRSSLEGKTLRFFTMGEKHPIMVVTLPVKRNYQPLAVMSIGIVIDNQFIAGLESIFNNLIFFNIGDEMVSSNKGLPLADALVADPSVQTLSTYLVRKIPSPLFYISGGAVYCLYDTGPMRDQIKSYSIISIIISLITLFIALFVGVVFYRKTFLKPFDKLMVGINKISGGDIQAPFDNPGKDEFGDLESAFNKMCSNLIRREKEIGRLSLYNSLILNNMKSGIITFSLEGKITTINPAAKRTLFKKENIPEEGVLSSLVLPEGILAFVTSGLKTGRDKNKISKEISLDIGGNKKILSSTLSPLMSLKGDRIGVISIFEDVTRIRMLEEKLRVSSRLAEMGEMAAGVAHQIKNPLAVMKVSMEMLREDLAYPEDDTEAGDLTGFILDEIGTLDSVVNNFLAFAKPKKGAMSYEDVQEILEFTIRSIPLDKFEGIDLIMEISETIGKHLFDRNLIVQALSNIIINAFQCSSKGDSIQIRSFMQKSSLIIEIEDNGGGMNEEIKAKIYNPFFTTKKTGTGLGLSIVHRIIEDHYGTIEVDSEPGKGTIFRLLFRGQK